MAMVDGSSGQRTATTGLATSQPVSSPRPRRPSNSRREFSASRRRRHGSPASLASAAREVAMVAGDDEAVNM